MRVLYLGKFAKSYATENYVAHAFESLGHEVKKYNLARSTFSGTCWHIQEFRPDIILTAKASKPHFSRLIPWCNARNITTVCWQWDLFFGYRRGPLPRQFFSKHLFTTDGGHEPNWISSGINSHQVLRQGIHEPEAVLYDSLKTPRYDVAFVGSNNTYQQRRHLFNWLRNTYGNRFIHIKDKRGITLNKALANVKVVVGDSYNVKNYWSNRIYEMTGRGGFLLHPKTVGLDSEFVDGEHYISYPRIGRVTSTQHFNRHLKPLIEKWIDPQHEEERQSIRVAAMNHCKENYTYAKRVEKLCEYISLY